MADLLALSERVIDHGEYAGPASVNRITTELSEVADGLAVVESFSHVVAFRTDEGLVLFDTSLDSLAPACLASLRGWSDAPVRAIVYTHGHRDHAAGTRTYLDEAETRGDARPEIIGHENVAHRFDRYELTDGYNAVINARQFGARGSPGQVAGGFFADWVRPDRSYRSEDTLSFGGSDFALHHGKGETDDHTWTWVPEHRAVCAGDFFIWVFPNAGNPQKAQRYPREWVDALRAMAATDPELFLPAHGLPIAGKERIQRVLYGVADTLERLVRDVLERMNAGQALDAIVQEVRVPQAVLDQPWMQPVYDEPEFVVRNIWRLYGGWYDGNPARLKPPPDSELAREVAALAGGVDVLVRRVSELASAGDLRLAAQVAEWAVQAAPQDASAHGARAEIYAARRAEEPSLMAKGIFGAAERESRPGG
ncbi:MAG TPA: alkyl sulfatase dimerization domain-containing protein [Acidimicrobiales bacterium]